MKDQCFLLPGEATCVVSLGRFGDLLLLFPAFKLMYERSRYKPIVMVSNEYASVMDGISYATPWVVNLRWWQDSAKAKQLAQRRYHNVVVPQYWNDLSEPKEETHRNGKVFFKAHGRTWLVEGESPDYGTAMWNRLGFTRAQMISEPLVLDRRSPEREAELVKKYIIPGKPTVLYNFTGYCSPFGYVPEMMALFREYQGRLNLVDVGQIKAMRLYDLLGLYDNARGILTSDTATLHLCPASKIKSIMFLVPTTGQSVPRGNCAFHCYYPEVPRNLDNIRRVLNTWATN